MDLESKGKFPTIEKAKELLGDKEKLKYFDLSIPDLKKNRVVESDMVGIEMDNRGGD